MGAKKSKLKWVLLGIVLIIVLFIALVNFITNWIWFAELDYVSVFLTKLMTQLKIGVPVFIVVTFLAFIYLKLIKKGYYEKIDSLAKNNDRSLHLFTWGLAIVFGGIVTFICVSQLWFQALQCFNSTDFGIKDPLYNNDISFYVFKLPFIEQVNTIIIGVTIVFIVLTLIYYALLISTRAPKVYEEPTPEPEDNERYDGTGNFEQGNHNSGGGPLGGGMFGKIFGQNFQNFAGGNPKSNINTPFQKKPKKFDDDNFKELLHIASKQLIAVGIIFFFMLAVHFFLKQFDLLQAHRGAVYGAGFTDVNITLWMYRVLMGLAIVSAITFIAGVIKKRVKTMVIVPIIMVILGIVGAGASALCQSFIVSPDEINKESKYLEYNIEYTQYAYSLENVEVKSFAAAGGLNSTDIANNQDTISNIRINDYSPTETFYNQTQSIRQYYNFNDVDVDRYDIDGDYTQVYLSPREIDETNISETWLNKHLKYTHGYGITLSRVDTVTESGQPDVLMGNIPPESKVDDLQVTRPEIYFGELTNNYLLVDTDESEFDYPDGDANQYCKYEGDAGINLGFLNRVLFSIREGSLKMLVSSNITKDSKIVINRNVEDRVKQIMPYLNYESDPYMCTVDGKLYWIIDAYTTTDRYPYSEPYDSSTGVNYIRNSVKIVIDAYNGTTDYYVMGDGDPIAATMKKIYPDLFKDFDDMPAGIQKHVRYPNTMFEIQSRVYQRYHMSDVNVFYQNEDLWEIADEIYGNKEQAMTPNYYIMKLPGEDGAEFVNSIPYTPKNKKNMTGLFVARNDGEKYGDLVLYKFPKSKVVYGPMQIEAQIDQNTEISKDFNLWSSSGTSYNRGNLFVIPIEDSLMYVEPVYLEAKNSSIPEVKKVIVVYNDKIAYESNLGDCLESLFGQGSSTAKASSSSKGSSNSGELSQSEYIKKAQEAYDNAQKALSDGNWSGYGNYMNDLENYLNKLQ